MARARVGPFSLSNTLRMATLKSSLRMSEVLTKTKVAFSSFFVVFVASLSDVFRLHLLALLASEFLFAVGEVTVGSVLATTSRKMSAWTGLHLDVRLSIPLYYILLVPTHVVLLLFQRFSFFADRHRFFGHESKFGADYDM